MNDLYDKVIKITGKVMWAFAIFIFVLLVLLSLQEFVIKKDILINNKLILEISRGPKANAIREEATKKYEEERKAKEEQRHQEFLQSEKNRRIYKINNLDYVMDNRTGLCFAILEYPRNFSHVPCTQEVKKITLNKEEKK